MSRRKRTTSTTVVRGSLRFAELRVNGVVVGRSINLEAELRTSMGISNQLALPAPASTNGSVQQRVPSPSSTPARRAEETNNKQTRRSR